ncbi:hypothetical protein C8J56DRAFT_174783 [Mycena floridula]|nr:hypothetical protein C8J56DRAFT_174783 [Mycena floridula]
MKFISSIALCLMLVIIAPITSACEGKCIVDTTKKFCEKYEAALDDIDLPKSQKAPILSQFKAKCYQAFETCIFPDTFHGKCQLNGQEPPGCPNSDCPVVCGTPGSIVHFYNTILIPLLFSCASEVLETIICGNSHSSLSERALSPSLRFTRSASTSLDPHRLHTRALWSRATDSCQNKDLFREVVSGLYFDSCGGPGWSKCSWETEMKEFILEFP